MVPQPKIPAHVALKHSRMEAVLTRLEKGFATAAMLAVAAGVTERNVYRYVVELRAAGEPIIGEARVGYILRRRRS